ncbi:acetyltransferase [Lacibacter sp.]|uniref:acetyltransferase n=1 Tax=Lacibacter sp. TaxID=1915409 RepID=UPI002B4AD274|nr:acetyltransferase [Lacibacter sp.]HLP36107.1 acetyltransferase [Lacibacter sp.]
MIIAGAGGHAREILDLLIKKAGEEIFLFDNVNAAAADSINGYALIRTAEEVKAQLQNDPRFIVGTGNPAVRQKMYELFLAWGGQPFTFIAATALVSEQQTTIDEAANIMHDAFISNHVQIGKGSLINTRAHLHHNVVTGNFCEIGPAALLLGNVHIGHRVFIGAGAILLPGIDVGDDAIIGAGAVVTKPVAAKQTVKGNPAV